MANRKLNVTSEIGKLKTVLLKRPGKELENLTPDYLPGLLFDDIPYLPVAQKEHDNFAQVLRDEGVEVLYLEQLMEEAIADEKIREQFIDQILEESQKTTLGHEEELKEFFKGLSNKDLVEKIMAGVRKDEIKAKGNRLVELMDDRYPFYLDPMPNLYFTRDPHATIGNGVTINRMFMTARRRESMFMDYIVKYHPDFKDQEIPVWFDRTSQFNIEGGDELVLSKNVLAIGVSERTSAQAIEELARSLFANPNNEFTKVIAVEIPVSRTFMHLDTVFTMIDYDKFTIHPGIEQKGGQINCYTLEKGDGEDIKITHTTDLKETLQDALGIEKIDFIPCGGGDPIISAREQWNDGSNTLCIAPGVVVTYDRNYVSNQLLRDKGIRVIEITGSELVRGRGGPRCMSQPLLREDI